MKLTLFELRHLPDLMGWFPDAHGCRIWAGPHFRFPFDASTFRADSLIDSMRTWSMETTTGELLGFGQYYAKAGRCHLARLAVAPNFRGRGYGRRLIEQLCSRGAADLDTMDFSLYVIHSNEQALRLYRRMGFVVAESHEQLPPGTERMLFMVATGAAAVELRCAED